MGLWDELPVDLLKKIEEHIELYQDKVRSKCVCTHWDRAFPELPDLRQEQPPWLLLPFTSGSLCGLFHPYEKKTFVIDLPEAGEKVFKGSGHGWAVSVQWDGSINVVNPLTRVRFALPPRTKFTDVLNHRPKKLGDEYLLRPFCIGRSPGFGPYHFPEPPYTLDSEHVSYHLIHKIALSCAPTSGGDFRAVAMYGETSRLAYCKLGDKRWTDMVKLNEPYSYKDITFCGGKLYTLNGQLELMVCDDIISCPKLRKLIPTWEGFGEINSNVHLVNSSDGGIMVVRRMIHCRQVHKTKHGCELEESKFIDKTSDFEIYKMNPTGSGWIRMESLASDEILFMGLGTELGIRGRSGNQIYFTDHMLCFNSQDIEDCFDQGIFSFEDKKMKSLGYEFNPEMIFPSPIWVKLNTY